MRNEYLDTQTSGKSRGARCRSGYARVKSSFAAASRLRVRPGAASVWPQMSVPIVPLTSFLNLAGGALAGDVRRLMAAPDLLGLVLFSDTSGEQLALLPVGAGQSYAALEEVGAAEIEGLRPLCALRLRGAEEGGPGEREREIARMEESLRARERYVAECEQRMAEVGQGLSEREAMLEQREQMLIEKEREFFRRSGESTRIAGQSGK
jgi:hypothetical protein